MTFSDIFKSSFLESVTEFSAVDTLIGLCFALVIGLFIFLIYKKTFSGIMYSTGFGMSLVGLSLVTTLVIMAVTSNVVLSLGMVGAFPCGNKRAYGDCVPFLGNCGWYRYRCRYDSACSNQFCDYRHYSCCVRKMQIQQHSVHPYRELR